MNTLTAEFLAGKFGEAEGRVRAALGSATPVSLLAPSRLGEGVTDGFDREFRLAFHAVGGGAACWLTDKPGGEPSGAWADWAARLSGVAAVLAAAPDRGGHWTRRASDLLRAQPPYSASEFRPLTDEDEASPSAAGAWGAHDLD